jgi:hypothetical protein
MNIYANASEDELIAHLDMLDGYDIEAFIAIANVAHERKLEKVLAVVEKINWDAEDLDIAPF